MPEKNPRRGAARPCIVALVLLMLTAALTLSGLSAGDGQRHRRPAGRGAGQRQPSVAPETETYTPCKTEVRASEVLIKFKRPVSPERTRAFIETLLKDRPHSIERVGSGSTLYLIHVTGMTVSDLLSQFTLARNRLRLTGSDDFDFDYVEPNFVFHKEARPNDPDFGLQWALQDAEAAGIHAESAWTTSTGSTDILVGVLDTGILYGHPDLKDNVWRASKDFEIQVGNTPPLKFHAGDHGFNAVDNNGDPLDLDQMDHHGTAVSGIIGATGNNGIDIAGVNWKAGIVGIRALDNIHNSMNVVINAIEFAVQFNTQTDPPDTRKIRVINNSYGYSTVKDERCRPQSLEQAIRDADAAGILFVASAGNDGQDNDVYPHYPSGLGIENIISVTGTNRKNKIDKGVSNYGVTSVDIAAPDTGIRSTIPSGSDCISAGTSLAAAFVSGSAALILSGCPHLTPVELKDCILKNADVIPGLKGSVGGGRHLNLNQAMIACGKCGG